jgi:N-glycosylase/DNA lyase
MVMEKEIIVGVSDFSLADTLECGQCFRYWKVEEQEYLIASGQKMIRVRQKENELTFYDASSEEVLNYWSNFFDIKRDYGKLKQTLSAEDAIMAEAIAFAPGVHILKQDFFECMISFILSQNNHIPRIKKMVETLCQTYGTLLGEGRYGFPTAEQMQGATEEKLRELGMGFRAKYIMDAIKKANSGQLPLADLEQMKTEELRNKLLSIYGVGRKVADCILLFSFERHEVFPTDVWVKRVMSYYYFQKEEVPLQEIFQLAQEKYGDNAGFAQQYLFHYARKNGIGKKGG